MKATQRSSKFSSLKHFFLTYSKHHASDLRSYFKTPQDFDKWLHSYFKKPSSKMLGFRFSKENVFERKVLKACAQIPPGEVRSYSWIAKKIHSPRSQRAVGNALSKNKLPVLIPCHRVVAKNGSLGGYRWGLKRKQMLLNWESGHDF